MAVSRLPRILRDDGGELRRIQPINLSITEKITPLSTASMVVPREESVPDRAFVELFVPGRSAGIYRARIPENAYGDARVTTIQLEHAVCEIGDWVITQAISESVLSLPAALAAVFRFYRGTHWQLGVIECTDDVVCNVNTGNVLSGMLGLLQQVPSGYFAFDFSTDPWTISVRMRPETVSAEGRLSRNIFSARIRQDDSQLYTRVYLAGLPVGASTDDIGHMDADTIDQYGIIETVLPAGDYTADEAQIVARAYLERHKRPITTVQIDGVDFSASTGEPLDALAIGKLYRLAIRDADPIEEHITQLNWKDVMSTRPVVSISLSQEEETGVKIIHEQGTKQVQSTNLADKRQAENQERKIATGTIVIDVAQYQNPTDYTVVMPNLGTINYGVSIAPDNESGDTPIVLSGFAYGISSKRQSSFSVRISIPTASLSGLSAVTLRWVVMTAKG